MRETRAALTGALGTASLPGFSDSQLEALRLTIEREQRNRDRSALDSLSRSHGGGADRPRDRSSEGHAERNTSGHLFREVPLFMKEESEEKLMRHAPPYGFKFGTFSVGELRAKRANATMPAVRKYDSCAVVGSSGTLLLAELGSEIDAHSAVWRINGGRAHPDFAAVAGMRTTIRVFSSPHAASDWSFKEQQLYPNTTVLVVCDRPFVYSCQNVLYATPKPTWHGINPIFYAAVRRTVDKRKGAIPLTGVTAVALAARMCNQVDVYGMSTMQSPEACFYYWHAKKGGRCNLRQGGTDAAYHRRPGDAAFHDFRGNAQALLRWNATGRIRLRG